jgi:uncharacterized protein YbjT (DUF2867 family)
MRVLVTGATGYIGGRLIPRLLAAGHEVTCLVRDPDKLEGRPWRDRVGVHKGDLLEPTSLSPALENQDVAYYLVHSMGRDDDFRSAEARSAENFRLAADEAGVRHVIYLGGLGSDENLSKHLSSRQDVGRILAAGSFPVTEFRAATVIGAGSLSFEMLRHLTDVLPVMTTPRWVRTRCQPIAIDDLLGILAAAGEKVPPQSRVVEVGGPDVLTYAEMMQIYAAEAGLRKRLIIPVPVLSPGLSSLWIGLVTPLPAAVARPLVSSLRNEVIVGNAELSEIPHTSFRTAVRRAIAAPPTPDAASIESDPALPQPSDPGWAGATRFIDQRTAVSRAPVTALAGAFTRIGGNNGYYTVDWAWTVRGLADRLLGGPGRRRGRRHPDLLEEGDELDFWRVSRLEPGRRLLLKAEMKMPGEAWLDFVAEPHPSGSKLVQTAHFEPRGLLGRLYWAALVPAHAFIFGRMAKKIAAIAETL